MEQEKFGIPEVLFILLGIVLVIPVVIGYWAIKLPKEGIRKLVLKVQI